MAYCYCDGFKALSTAVGGVPVCIPEATYDVFQKKQWTAGEHLLKGKEALQYVRQRHGLASGDFDRIDRQQNFLRSLMTKILEAGTLGSPIKLSKTLEALTRNLTVDEAWTPGDMRGLALSLRGTKADDVEFSTLPITGTSVHPTYGDIVNMDPVKSQELFSALKTDSVETYLKKCPEDKLKPDKDDKERRATETPPETTEPTPTTAAPDECALPIKRELKQKSDNLVMTNFAVDLSIHREDPMAIDTLVAMWRDAANLM